MSLSPVLNYDILLEVLKICPRAECSRLMRTCRFLHTHGFEALLSPPITIKTHKDLLPFLTCFQTDADKRCKYVRSLQFNFYNLTELAALELANTLPRMSNLEVLSLAYSDDTIMSHPDLLGAFAALTSVRELRLGCAREHTFRMLQSLRSKLVTLNMDFLGVPPNGEGFFESVPLEDVPLYHPAVIMEHSRSSLQSITSYGWDMDVDTLPDPALVYPQMRRLDLEGSFLPRTMAYIIAYPNLTHLRFHTFDSEMGHYDASNLEEYDTRHALNVSDQVSSGLTWDSLHEYGGGLLDLYLLGLTCTVEIVQLHSLYDALDYMLQPVLSYTRPRQLTLEHWPSNLRDTPPSEVFAALRGDASSRLETLSVEAGLEEKDSSVDIAAILVRARRPSPCMNVSS